MAYARLTFILQCGAVTALIGSVACLLVCVLLPIQEMPVPALEVDSASSEVESSSPASWSFVDFGETLSKPLQGPLHDATASPVAAVPTAPPAPSKAKPNINIRLIGTVVELDHEKSRAWLKLPGGGDVMLGIGKQIDGITVPAQIRSICPKRVVLDLDGFEHVVEQME